MKLFQHFIITRFNVRRADWLHDRNQQPVLTDEWMSHRFNLFESYCFPSLKAQSEPDFCWLVFFDTTTTEPFRSIASRLNKEFPAFQPVYIDGMDSFLPALKQEIGARLFAPYVITSRLDNDDALHRDYVRVVHGHFQEQESMVVDLVDGYTLQIDPVVRIGKRTQVNNPFQSLIERADDFKTIWHIDSHGQWGKTRNVLYVRDCRMWMPVIHQANKVNGFMGFDDVDWGVVGDFNLRAETLSALSHSVVPVEDWRWLSLYNKICTELKFNYKRLKRKLRGLG